LGTSIPRGVPVPTAHIDVIRMGTTVATNALLERQGAKTALLITEGFRDLLHIGTQSRPDIFDLTAAAPSVLYSAVVEVPERLVLHKTPEGPNAKQAEPQVLYQANDFFQGPPAAEQGGGGAAEDAAWCAAVPSSVAVAAAMRSITEADLEAVFDADRTEISQDLAVAAGYLCLMAEEAASWPAAVRVVAGGGGKRLLRNMRDPTFDNGAKPRVCKNLLRKGFQDALLQRWWSGTASNAEGAVAAVLLHMAHHAQACIVMPAVQVFQEETGAVKVAAVARGVGQTPPPRAATASVAAGDVVVGITGEALQVRRALDAESMRPALEALVADGYTSAAIVLLHSYAWDGHERALAAVAKEAGFAQVSTSSGVMRMVKAVPRGYTTCADAYLTPHILKYVAGFQAGFDAGMASGRVRVQFMQSDGGLTPVSGFSGHRAVLSGPAGGVVGYAMTTARVLQDVAATGVKLPNDGSCVVGYDMGGTSTDVSRYAGSYEHVFECVTAGVTIQAPQLDISTVAAGGGSRLFFHEGMFVVGPQSAGAHPGPVCYRKQGHLAVTDANVQLGRVVPEHFPAIFGESEDQPLDVQGTAEAFQALRGDMLQWRQEQGDSSAADVGSIDEIAFGFVQVANEAMCRPIRELTQMKGHDLGKHTLACFGGAGGQHACAMARALGMRSVVVHRYSGILSAYGLALADVVQEEQEPVGSAVGQQAQESQDAIDALVAHSSGLRNAVLRSSIAVANAGSTQGAAERLLRLACVAAAQLKDQGFAEDVQYVQPFVNLRFTGTDTALMVPAVVEGGCTAGPAHSLPLSALGGGDEAALQLLAGGVQHAVTEFVLMYKREYGFTFPGAAIVVEDVRVRVTALSAAAAEGVPSFEEVPAPGSTSDLPAPLATRSVYFEGGRVPTPFYALGSLARGHAVAGPAVLVDATSTLVVEPHCTAHVGQGGDIAIVLHTGSRAGAGGVADAADVEVAALTGDTGAEDAAAPGDVPCDPIQLGVFSHRFMSIAEQMGRTLQRTSISVNIKERLDFSCALFSGCMLGGDGEVDIASSGTLVSNAPHIPVHLGAMSAAVRYQLQHYLQAGTGGLRPGDVLVSNHPQLAGGSHLPDMTVITPVFLRDRGGGIGDATSADGVAANPIVFFVASRGHHSDIGGIAPGSMPPTSSSLAEEGATIVTCKLVESGFFREYDIKTLLQAPGKLGIPGCVGCRNIPDVLSDLRAQVAANERGVHLIRSLCAAEGLHVVHSYMRHIQANAEHSVRTMLKAHAHKVARQQGRSISTERPSVQLAAQDFMDDGSVIDLQLTLDGMSGDACFDFGGTSSEVLGNTNAPPAVTSSAVIYALRCLVGRDIPLNEGCLAPVTLRIPPGCLLNPSPEAAVVGGNVLTSQRVTDVVLKAFAAAAASQGCMNNLTFGDNSMGFYETICGGAGAGPTWSGRSGVHTHMTNTRITDPEIIEKRYPIVLRAFFLRSGSGGAGARRGGDGVIRALEFRRPLQCSILSERRAFAPWGLAGGGPGARGINLLFRANAPPSQPSDLPPSVVMGVQVSEAGGAGGRVLNVGGKRTFSVGAGDVFVVATPGGGGYGEQGEGGAEAPVEQVGLSSALGGGSWGALKAEQASF